MPSSALQSLTVKPGEVVSDLVLWVLDEFDNVVVFDEPVVVSVAIWDDDGQLEPNTTVVLSHVQEPSDAHKHMEVGIELFGRPYSVSELVFSVTSEVHGDSETVSSVVELELNSCDGNNGEVVAPYFQNRQYSTCGRSDGNKPPLCSPPPYDLEWLLGESSSNVTGCSC
jgi:hypothetical protein